MDVWRDVYKSAYLLHFGEKNVFEVYSDQLLNIPPRNWNKNIHQRDYAGLASVGDSYGAIIIYV